MLAHGVSMLVTLPAMTFKSDPALHADEALVAAGGEAVSPLDRADASFASGARHFWR
jgi:hypothetical protein